MSNTSGTPLLSPSLNGEGPDLEKVLVLGGGDIALSLSEVLAQNGLQVVSVGGSRSPCSSGIRMIPDGVLKQIQGSVGRFTAIIDTPDGSREEKAGFVVAAYPAEVIPQFDIYGVQPSERVISLSSFRDALRTRSFADLRTQEWLHVAFLMGLRGEGDTTAFEDILSCIEMLRSQEKVQPYVFTRNVKVAEEGLEARYRRARESGTLFFRFDDHGPDLQYHSPDLVKIVFSDPQLLCDMEFTPDILVIDEQRLPSHDLETLLNLMPSSLTTRPYLTPDSPRFPHVETSKAGVFALGPARGEFYPARIHRDIDTTVAALKRLACVAHRPLAEKSAWVNEDQCTLCLTCVRMCPHGAVNFSSAASVDRLSCVGCGICVGVCPMRAISLDGIDPGKRGQGVSGVPLKGSEPSKEAGIVGFLCEHSAANAFEELPINLRTLVHPVAVPCAGSLTESDILAAFLGGADAVIVAGCFQGNCRSIYGTTIGSHRVSSIQAALENIGIPSNRLVFVPSASNASENIRIAVSNLANTQGSS
jgi:coenzyme F420-reducing hydrogenase delta subunit/NAD-dependent dihydropyrimidine dehydrogenase PreA subunit